MKKKICLIGYNYGKNVLIKSINSINNFNLIGVCGQRARQASHSSKFQYYTSWREMLKKLKPDLVVIAVPPLEQKKILYYLLKNKIQFLCQKPLTNSLTDIYKLSLLNKTYRKKNLIDLNFITIPSIIRFKDIIKKIKINKDTQIDIKWRFKPLSKNFSNSWKNNKKSLGGEINNFFFHLVSIMYFLFKAKKLQLIKKKQQIYYFKLILKNSEVKIVFDPNNDKNLLTINLHGKKFFYKLENKSKDYHNNFLIKKNNKVIFKKNFPKEKSRIYASKEILKNFNKKNKKINKFLSFEFGLMLQKKIIQLNAG